MIHFVKRIKLTRAILVPLFSNFLRNSSIHFRMFLYLETCFLVTVLLLCRLQAVSKIHVPIYPYLISEGRRNCTTLWPAQQRNRDSQNTLPNIKTCENGWSNFSENLRIVALKLLINLILITKSINFQLFTLNFVWCWGCGGVLVTTLSQVIILIGGHQSG